MDINEKQDQKISEAFNVTPELLPYLPELLADIYVLGSWPNVIVQLLRPLPLPPQSTRVLDLGCGKGAVAVAIAQELHFHVLGIDLFPPFIQEANIRAKEDGLVNLCQFEMSDMRDAMKKYRNFDVVIFAGVGGVLGNFSRCVEQLRRTIPSRGYMVIDDGFLAQTEKLDRPGYEHYRSYNETIRQLTVHGDTLVQEMLIPVEELKAYNKKNTERIRKRAEKLAEHHPELADNFNRYVQWEEVESRVLETETIPAVWLLQRA